MRDLKYLDAMVHETLRCFPPVLNAALRVTSREVSVNGVTIPKGTKRGLAVWPVHYSEVRAVLQLDVGL